MATKNRLDTIIDLRLNQKMSLRAIADRIGLTHERVRQILQAHGIKTSRSQPTGRRVRSGYNLDPERVQHLYGCSLEELRAVQGRATLSDPHSPASMYRLHRKRHLREPGWELSFPQWWTLWGGRWSKRERWVLTPLHDDQPVSLSNVSLITRSELMRRYWKTKKEGGET